MKIILINGQGGTGKSSIANTLKNSLSSSAYIDADALIAVSPFNFNEVDDLLLKNAVSLIHNFSEKGYEYIITAGLTRNQELLNKFQRLLNKEVDIMFIWLRASKEVRMSRKVGRSRDDADNLEHFEFVDTVYPDIERFEIKNGVYLEIDTSSKSIENIVSEIKSGM
jgi:chloramphenicol 3-O-phosphotransferase